MNPQQPLATNGSQELFESYLHGASCASCRTNDATKRSRVTQLENALYDIFYREAAPHKAHVCCPNYVLRELIERTGVKLGEIMDALRDTMGDHAPLTSVHVYHEASRYVLLRRLDAHVDAIEERLERLERLEARVTALEAEVEFLRGLDNARHVDMLHASKKRMYEEAADKKI